MKFLLVLSVLSSLLAYTVKQPAQAPSGVTIDGVTYNAVLYGDQSVAIKAGKKTVLHIKRAELYITFEHFSKFEFKDFNGDGYPDILIDYKSDIPGKSDLILYDKALKNFVQVAHFADYPASVRIANTSFYYSYRANGCSDMDWESDLYKIVNNRIIPVGNMAGRGCASAKETQGIYLSKIKARGIMPVGKLPIDELAGNGSNKSTFIAQYWKLNYLKF